MCCDVSLISQRLRAGLGGVGEGKGGVRSRKFRARIKPDENQSAEQELRKQIRYNIHTLCKVLEITKNVFLLSHSQ